MVFTSDRMRMRKLRLQIYDFALILKLAAERHLQMQDFEF